MKKRILGAILMIVITMSTAILSVSAESVSVKLNGNDVHFDVAPQIVNDRTMVPMRVIFEALGYDVEWNSNSKQISASGMDGTVVMKINDGVFYRNGISYRSDVAPTIINDRTLVPLRALGEALNYDVYWDSPTYTVWLEKYNGVITMSEAVNLVKNSIKIYGNETFILVGSGYKEYVKDDCFSIRMEFPGDFPDEIYQNVFWVSKKTGKIVGNIG